MGSAFGTIIASFASPIWKIDKNAIEILESILQVADHSGSKGNNVQIIFFIMNEKSK